MGNGEESTGDSVDLADKARKVYREWLVTTEHTASRDFDRAVMTLSGGALGISIAFIKDIAPHPVHEWIMAVGWALFAVSLVAILSSLLTSQYAIRWAIWGVDTGAVDQQAPGGTFGRVTLVLNAVAGVAFVLGVCALATFAFVNLREG